MAIADKINEILNSLPPDRQLELLEFAESLSRLCVRGAPLKSVEGIWADLGISFSEEEIDEARREIWTISPKKGFKCLKIDYPDSLPDLLQESVAQFEQEAKMAMAVKLFEMKRISSGIAAQIMGMERADFLLKLHEYGVSAINMDEDELAKDVADA